MPYDGKLPTESDQLPVFFGAEYRPGDPLERFSHMAVAVTDLDRSETWYRDVIGLDLMGRNLTAEARPHSVLRMNTGQLLILVQHDRVERVRQSGHGVHHGFLLTQSQYRRAVERLKEHGIEVVAQREEFNARGQYSIDVYDPDGHHYQIETTDPAQAKEIVFPKAGVVDCGPADHYQVGEVRLFRDGNFFLVRLKEGFLALSRWCTHMNGLIVYQEAHWRFWCPMHQATYDRRGNPTCSTSRHPDLPALRLNPITFSPDGRVLVDTDQIIERKAYHPAEAVQPPATVANWELKSEE